MDMPVLLKYRCVIVAVCECINLSNNVSKKYLDAEMPGWDKNVNSKSHNVRQLFSFQSNHSL